MAAVGLQSLALYAPEVPSAPSGFQVPGLDKLAHFGLFALATWALTRVLPVRWAVGLMLVQAGLSEGVQGLVLAHRSADGLDLLADLVGTSLGWWAAAVRVEQRATRAMGARRP